MRAEGDAAVRRFTQQFDGAALDDLRVSAAEFREARAALTRRQIAALERAVANVARFHEAQLPAAAVASRPCRACAANASRGPIDSVGLYVPAGSAPLPSTAIMLAVPARIAGCPARAIASSPGARRQSCTPRCWWRPSCAASRPCSRSAARRPLPRWPTARESVRKVDKIFGPGSAWVTAAKQIVAGDPAGAAIDLPAGPSEVLVIADDSANARFVAADLLAQAEHDTHRAGDPRHDFRRAWRRPSVNELARADDAALTPARHRRAVDGRAAAASSCPISTPRSRCRTNTRPST